MSEERPTLLHVVTDYPDGVNPVSTTAVKNLIDACPELDHRVISVVRENRLSFNLETRGDLLIYRIPKLPLGLFSSEICLLAGWLLYRKLKGITERATAIHAHKLCIDGILAYVLAQKSGRTLITSVRGTTDEKWVRRKFLYRWLYRKVLERSETIFWVSLWPKDSILSMLSLPLTFKGQVLPNICTMDISVIDPINSKGKFLFVGRLDDARNKGLLDVFRALKGHKECTLNVVGGGTDETLAFLQKYVNELEIDDRVSFSGKLNREQLQKCYGDHCAMLMPSFPETFGMVYIEALASGLPVLCCKDSGIYGYFTDSPYVQYVDFGRIDQINNAISFFNTNEIKIKDALRQDIKRGELNKFFAKDISSTYQNEVQKIKGFCL